MKVKVEHSVSYMVDVSDEDRKIPFFDKVDSYIRKMQNEESINRRYLTTPKGRKDTILGWIEQPTVQKYFNYLLQVRQKRSLTLKQ